VNMPALAGRRAASLLLRISSGRRCVSAPRRNLSTAEELADSSSSEPQWLILADDCSWKGVGHTVAQLGRRCLLVHGGSERGKAAAQRALFEMRKARVECATFTVQQRYPSADTVTQALSMARRIGATIVVGLGSGGVVDTAKAVAALAGSSGKVLQYLESPSDGVLGSASGGGAVNYR
jgi:alcohol dehydrogenase YqhD (iron-dependent ADH family)